MCARHRTSLSVSHSFDGSYWIATELRGSPLLMLKTVRKSPFSCNSSARPNFGRRLSRYAPCHGAHKKQPERARQRSATPAM
jgi:hypothetical protein